MARITALITALGCLLLLAQAIRADVTPDTIGIRYSTTVDNVRVVLDLPREVTFTNHSTPQQVQVSLDLPLPAALPIITLIDPIVTAITVVPDADGHAQLTIPLQKARKSTVFTLKAVGGKPDRLVVDIIKRFHNEESRVLSPGIIYTHIEEQTDDHYLAVHYVEADTKDPHIHLNVVAAQGERERVSSMVTRTGALCGVNGGYFMEGTRPVGLLKTGGQILSLPIWGRTAVAFPANGAPVFSNPKGVWRLTLPDGAVRDLPDLLDASILNPLPPTMVYNGNLLTQVPANPGGQTVLIQNGKVVSRTIELLPLKPGDLAIRLTEDDVRTFDPLLAVGAVATLTPMLDPTWQEFLHAVGAGPRLLRNGDVAVTGLDEHFKPDILQGRHARTGLGVTDKAMLVLAVVEAPGPYGGGVTLEEFAGLLKARKAVDALNLDGGGSSCLAIGGQTVNYPPGAWIRPVASGVLISDDRVVPVNPVVTPAPPAASPTQPADGHDSPDNPESQIQNPK